MIIRKLGEIKNTAREVTPGSGNWTSYRLLLKSDTMGFSLHDTLVRAGTVNKMWYKHHLEAVYCVSGKGELEDLNTGKVYPIQDGTLYALDKHDLHCLRAITDMRMICVFNPPLTGREVHDGKGIYPLMEEDRI